MQRILTVIGIWLGILNIYATVWTDCNLEFIKKDVHLKAGKVAAKDLTLESKSGKVKLEAGKDEDFYRHYHKSSGLITTSVDDEGHDRKVSKPVEIAAQTVTVPSPAEIDYKASLGKEFREALAGRTDIDWKVVQDHYREWSEHTTTLSGPARMLVACVLSVVTQNMGTSEWLAGHGIAEGTATNAALSSGIQTLAASAGTALAANLGDLSKAFDELTSAAALKNLTASILSAGLQLDTAASLPEATLKSAESLAIQTGLQNRKLGDILISDVVDAGAAQVAHGIGSAHATGTLGELSHKAAHGALAVAGAKLTGRDPVGAAVGAIVGEVVGGMVLDRKAQNALQETLIEAQTSDRLLSREEFDALFNEKLQQASTSAGHAGQIAAAAVTFVGGMDVNSGYDAARNATENNLSISGVVKATGKAAGKVLGGPIVNGILTVGSVAEYAYKYYVAHQNQDAEAKAEVAKSAGKEAATTVALAAATPAVVKVGTGVVKKTKNLVEAGKKSQRIVDTQIGRDLYIKTKVNIGEFRKYKTINGRSTWTNNDKTRFYQKTKEQWEIEVYNKHGKHIGVIKPNDGSFHPELAVKGREINVK